jgi:hypothetical protein
MEGKMHEEILDKMQDLLKEEIENFAGDFGKTEETVMNLMMSLGRGLLQRAVNLSNNGYKGSSIACKCGGSMKFVQYRSRDIQTLCGCITIKRAYYYCSSCGAGTSPYDKAGGLGSEKVSPAMAKACCTLAVDDSFEHTSRKIEELFGQKISDNTVERIVHQVGNVVLAGQDAKLDNFLTRRQIPDAQVSPQKLYICPDGTTVHEKDGWHETKVGSIYWEDERFGRHQRYVGRFNASDVFGNYLWLEACRCGLRQAMEIVYLGDGAGWVRTIHNTHFVKATFIVDWFHASEHIWDCGKVLLGEGTDETARWVKRRQALLWDGCTRKLLNDLKKWSSRCRGEKQEAIRTLYRYISVNEEQMRYDVFRAKGYDIGSGAVEGACKHVVGKRLKQSGMIWTRAGSSATLALRINWLNKEWDELWSKKPLAA